MNKTAVKNYAVEARKKWIQAIAQQAAFYGCTEKGSLSEADITKQLAGSGVFLTANEKSARSALVNDINEKGYRNAIEEIAYTWFNRLIAIRFMEVNGYLPSGIRVLSSIDAGRIEPDCVREYARLDFLNQDTAAKLAAESDEKLYRYILVEQCNALGNIMPKMFTHIGGIAALLLPERLYIKDGLVHDLTHIKDVEEKDFGEQIQTIGWLYQYYISEKKDEVFAALKKNVKITRENIPAATQLFTPEWIVKYMVENSLGRLWLESHPDSGLREGWKYYIDEAEQEPAVAEQLRVLRAQNPVNRPEDIKLIDPCMGSGHILVYAYDVLYQIYFSQGYSERSIPDLILENNIFGLDIDERACQLAYFALMMKARSYNRRFFRRENVTQPQVYSPQGYEEGMEYGSLIKVKELEKKPTPKKIQTLFDTPYETELNTWNFRCLLNQKYDVVVTNPPYMGSSGMGTKLSDYVKENYPDSKSDISTAFMEQTLSFCKSTGFVAMINIPVWMFITSYKALRKAILHNNTIVNMLHFGRGVFGSDFGTTAFIIAKTNIARYRSAFQRLYLVHGAVDSVEQKEQWFFEGVGKYSASQSQFLKIPGTPLAYWVSTDFINSFSNGVLIGKLGQVSEGIKTGDNDKFLRYWYEISALKFSFAKVQADYKWFPYHKGGDFRKWFGNNTYAINWEFDGKEIKNQHNSGLQGKTMYFKPVIGYSKISARGNPMRYYDKGVLFDSMAPSILLREHQLFILGLLNTTVGIYYIRVLNPTMATQVGDIKNIPVIIKNNEQVEAIVSRNVAISRADWDSFETSWDFQTHPLIMARGNYEEAQPLMLADDIAEGTIVTEWSKTSAPIAQAFDTWERETDRRFNTLKANEEELNRIFIDIYGMQDELTPEVEDKDVTVRRADLGREIRSLISYAVGCMFGRYSLDVPGLVLAGQAYESKFKHNLQITYNDEGVERTEPLHGVLVEGNDGKLHPCSFLPEDDNILPITDANYFEDDIVMRFEDFVKVVYGEDTLAENLEFIARALYPNGNGTAREMIRRYFINDFFKDHCKVYQKRPIYWLFDSGKQNGFKALIYLHRYDKYTVARVRTEYLHPLQRSYEAEIDRMSKLADLPETSARDKAEFRKQTEKIEKQLAECRAYDQIISHIAAGAIELDLDDGVKVNYEKFQGVEVPRGDGKGTIKMDLLGKI